MLYQLRRMLGRLLLGHHRLSHGYRSGQVIRLREIRGGGSDLGKRAGLLLLLRLLLLRLLLRLHRL